MIRRIVHWLLFLFLLTDLTYSFVQHLSMPLDGDMAGGIVPGDDVKRVFADPFGVSVITQNAVYPNPNRFFAHWAFLTYFRHAPFVLQTLFQPIDSIYVASAAAKISIQIVLLLLLAFGITGNRKISSTAFLTAAALVVPFFQTNGYRGSMGIIDPAVTYTFFYALPCMLLVLFYYPFFKTAYYGVPFMPNRLQRLVWLALAVVVVFNGPLNPGVLLIVALLYLGHNWRLHYALTPPGAPVWTRIWSALNHIPKPPLFILGITGILSVYALLIGFNNAIFLDSNLPILQRFCRLPLGLYYLLSIRIGYPVLLLMVGINTYLISRYYRNTEGRRILNFFTWMGIFTFFYLLLLPFGGYKHYRPYILRYDTVMPVTIALVFMYGQSAYFLITHLTGRSKRIYLAGVMGVALLFTAADQPEFTKNACERAALRTMAQAQEPVVLLTSDCNVLTWGPVKEPNESALNAQLLYYWGVTRDKKLYYQK